MSVGTGCSQNVWVICVILSKSLTLLPYQCSLCLCGSFLLHLPQCWHSNPCYPLSLHCNAPLNSRLSLSHWMLFLLLPYSLLCVSSPSCFYLVKTNHSENNQSGSLTEIQHISWAEKEVWHRPNPFRKLSVHSWWKGGRMKAEGCTYADTFRSWVTLWASWALQQSTDCGEENPLLQHLQALTFESLN